MNGGKHSRSTAQLDVAKISLTARVGPTESPVPARPAQALAKGGSENVSLEAYKKSLPSKQAVKEHLRKSVVVGYHGAGGLRQGAQSQMGMLNVSSNSRPRVA